MKRLIVSLAVSLGLVLVSVSSAVAARYWELQMFDPAPTTNRTINIEFKVMSTEQSDTFKVELFENGTSKGVKNIDTDYGDSGVFNVAVPASGTYTYRIDAINNGNASTDTESRIVQVNDGPEPTVTTIFTNNGAGAGGQGAGGVQAAAVGGAGAGGGGAGAVDDDGEVAGAAADEGQVDAEASATDENGEARENGDVLGASGQAETDGRSSWRSPLLIVLALGIAGGSAYWFLVRPRISA